MAAIATVRARAKALATQHKADPRALATLALKTAPKDEQLAFELFRASKKAVLTLTPREVESLLAHLHDWASTDCFACFVSGVAWREGLLTDKTIHAWAKSNNLWTRRAALVSTIPLNCKARGATSANGEAKKTLAICATLVSDREDMIVKALSWALRELINKDNAALNAFLTTHNDRLPARAKREVSNKLTTGLKNPRKS